MLALSERILIGSQHKENQLLVHSLSSSVHIMDGISIFQCKDGGGTLDSI
jgi:hypothetical protein